MFDKKLVRGNDTESNKGANSDYYLYVGIFYRTMSPGHRKSEVDTRAIYIGVNGQLSDNIVQSSDGGVQFIELCYELSFGPRLGR